jgi:hypothetical protein
MRDRPESAELLGLAREVLLRDVMPFLSAERSEQIMLIARAMAIAERELKAGSTPITECHAALRKLYGDGDFAMLWRRLAAKIRTGTYDTSGFAREEVRRLLFAVTVQKLRESNPDYLAASGVDQTDQSSQNGSA